MQSRRQAVRCKISVKRYKARHLEFPDFLQYHDNSVLPSRFLGLPRRKGVQGRTRPGFAKNSLAVAGIGRISIAEDDTVSLNNLNRQILYNPANIGKARPRAFRPDLEMEILDLPLGEAARAAMRHFDMTGRRSAAWMRGWISAAFSTRRKAVCQRRTARKRFLLFGFLDGPCPSCVYPPILHRGRKFPRRARPS